MASDPDTPLMRLHLDPSLPCGLHGCGQPAATGLAEPDPECAGLWLLLPLCTACRQRLSNQEEHGTLSLHGAVRRERSLTDRSRAGPDDPY